MCADLRVLFSTSSKSIHCGNRSVSKVCHNNLLNFFNSWHVLCKLLIAIQLRYKSPPYLCIFAVQLRDTYLYLWKGIILWALYKRQDEPMFGWEATHHGGATFPYLKKNMACKPSFNCLVRERETHDPISPLTSKGPITQMMKAWPYWMSHHLWC